MTYSKLWFKPSRIVWLPSIFNCRSNRQIAIDWLKWKIIIYDPPTMIEIKAGCEWLFIGGMAVLTIALWYISEGWV